MVNYRNIVLWLGIIIATIILFNIFNKSQYSQNQMSYSEFVSSVNSNLIKKVTIKDEKEIYFSINNEQYKTYILPASAPSIIDLLTKHNVKIDIVPKEKNTMLDIFLMYWAPMIVFLILFFYFSNQMQKGGKVLSFNKSNAQLITSDKNPITFKDVAGVEEAKEELQEIIEFLKYPKKFIQLGAKIPKGVLLVGPPGTGKTLLAKAVAGEAKVPFYSISGSDFVEMFVGVGASRVRDLFAQAKRSAPCIVFIDEIDAVGRQRGAGIGGGHDEREQTLNQLLVEMDGFQTHESVIIMAATNRPDVLDPALLRPGRFDRRVIVSKSDVRGRLEILKVHTRNIPLAKNVNLEIIAKSTPGFSGADLSNLVNEAVLFAARKNKKEVEMEDFELAKDKVLMGPERKSVIISDEEKEITAYHESGHAIVAKLLPKTDPIHKVTIIPRGMALGVTQQLPEGDKYTYDKEYLINRICVLLGGRVSEEVMLNTITTGAGNDIERATDIARKMVCEWGMSELGPLNYATSKDEVFLGREIATHKNFSEDTARLIDREIKRIIDDAYQTTKNIILQHKGHITKMAQTLLEKEVITSADIDEILKEPQSEV
ncbi:ATP-dependent metalloprotease [Desulfurella acetivorans A63]|nr:ATP-dependent metalloprotease [Desulfurella acetivorans A63]